MERGGSRDIKGRALLASNVCKDLSKSVVSDGENVGRIISWEVWKWDTIFGRKETSGKRVTLLG